MVPTSSCKQSHRYPNRFQTNWVRWIGRDAVPALLQDVFGVEDRTQLKQGKASLPILDNEYSERVRAGTWSSREVYPLECLLKSLVIEKSRDHKSKGVGSITLPTLYIVKEDGDPSLKLWAQTLLVEDRADQGESIVQWISKLREKVRVSSDDTVPLILSTWPD